jgi:hypothetical protein
MLRVNDTAGDDNLLRATVRPFQQLQDIRQPIESGTGSGPKNRGRVR